MGWAKLGFKFVPDHVHVPNVLAMTISFIFHEYRLNHVLIQCLLNQLECIDSVWCDSYQYKSNRNLCDYKLQNFHTQPFQLQNHFCARLFKFYFASKVFTFTFCYTMTWKDAVGEI